MAIKKTSLDIDGQDLMSKVLLDLINKFPGFKDKKVEFAHLGSEGGIALYPSGGAALLNSKKDITGRVTQTCLFPFSIVWKAAPSTEKMRINVKELLDLLGKWLEQQPVIVNGKEYQLKDYPATDGSRVIKSVVRTQAAYLDSVEANSIENWVISANLHYENKYNT